MERKEESYPNYFVHSPSVGFDGSKSDFQSPVRSDVTPLVLTRVDDFPGYSVFLEYSEKNCLYEDEKEFIFVESSYNSRWWIALQILWRFLFSFGVALLVFYIATQPPNPNFSVRIGRVEEFKLEEGVDSHGVATKLLTCNCSVNLIVDNKSNVFGLHIHPPSINFFFGPFIFAKSQGPELLYANSHESTAFRLYIGTKDLAVYGAGREMDDMLKSRAGLSLILRMNIISDFRVVWNIINPKFHHQAECLLRLLYDQRHKRVTLVRNTCRLVS